MHQIFVSLQERVNKDFEIMFETGVDEMSWDDTVSLHYLLSSLRHTRRAYSCSFFVSLFLSPLLGKLSHGWVL